MKQIPSAMLTLINSGPTQLERADLFTFTLVSGLVFNWTDYDADVTMGSTTYVHNGPIVERTSIKWSNSAAVDSMSIKLDDDGSTLVGAIPLLVAIALGLFDGASVVVSRALSSAKGAAWTGPLVLFTGTVGEIGNLGRSTVKFTVNSTLEQLMTDIPYNLIMPSCRWTLFDSGCKLLKSSFLITGTLTAGSNNSKLQSNLTQTGPAAAPTVAPSLNHTSGASIPPYTYYVTYTYVNTLGETMASPEAKITLTLNQRLVVTSPSNPGGMLGWNCYVALASGDEELQNFTPIAFGTNFTMPNYQQGPVSGVSPPLVNQTGYFDLGYLTFTSGANAGLTFTVDEYLGAGVITIRKVLPFPPSVGDTFSILPGCNKAMTTCNYKFSNLANFGGFPFVPTPETAL